MPGSRPAAVLVPLFEADGEAHVILTKRPDTMPSHKGEISFPGGGLRAGVDASLQDAALREAEEEIGLPPGAVEVVAELDTLATVGSPRCAWDSGRRYRGASGDDSGFRKPTARPGFARLYL